MPLYYLKDKIIKQTTFILKRLPFWVSFIALFLMIYDLGFNTLNDYHYHLNVFYNICLSIGMLAIVRRYFNKDNHETLGVKIFDCFSIVLFLILIIARWQPEHTIRFFDSNAVISFGLFLMLVREFSVLQLNLKQTRMNPAQLFVVSFLLIIFIGAFMLSFPKATNTPGSMRYIDALFTATSAVCVTGLSTVDIGAQFTIFGKTVMIFLMECGGLGIMTLASYFSFFFRGKASYGNQLVLKDMSYIDKLGDVFATLKRIIIISGIIQFIGMIAIFISIRHQHFESLFDRVFFSIFHAVSAFCNAGFSTLPENLYTFEYRFNYPLHLIIAGLFIMGGLGFPIVFNVYKYVKHLIINKLLPFSMKEAKIHIPRVINLSTRIILITTAVLIVGGTAVVYISEYNNTLAEHSGFGKLVTAFFTATSPRTAGFATVDNNLFTTSTFLVVILLMWIGASPVSTGGGIKTSTFAIAVLNIWALMKGRSRIEVYRREVDQLSVQRAFAIIFLSLFVIGIAIFALSFFEPKTDLLRLAYEAFSAYSTSGLSTGITAQLTDPSKVTLIMLMFIGRVSMLTILIAISKKEKLTNYRYPTEEILIN
ncbi:ATPase [Myroides odoratimimus]|uniref:Potassium uptake protein, TrkH family n=2 Tax=Myroides TaxID=76831 RepID=A0AAJ4W278_MYRPR|nr:MULTISPECIES: potassium transporter TrkG [Myroides]AJA70079.1 Ktr system potassium uptake protein B [Myroides sp. A21]SEQ31187.1 potassium uptake protein, TrkH family [Myroides profundi]APA93344.1 ATPase [Myroides sp. ZB35]EHO09614.1 TrkH family potassium uptake protein [Myroides odoratimimus CCUG 12901]EHO11834.1 TrkH family potassium uptake protein [Myroides odoratimimus CIP 101113]